MKVTNILFLFTLAFVGTVLQACSCQKPRPPKPKKTITTEQVKEFLIVNVLDEEFYKACHFDSPHEINIPLDGLRAFLEAPEQNGLDKQKTELVFACTGYRCSASHAAYTIATELGYEKASVFSGGMAEAKYAGIPMHGTDCNASWLEDYKKPEGMEEDPEVRTISVEKLQTLLKDA